MAIMGAGNLVFLQKGIDMIILQITERRILLIQNLVETEVDGALTNYMRGIAEKNRELLAYYYKQAQMSPDGKILPKGGLGKG